MLVYSRKEPSIRTSFPHRQSHHLSSFPFALCFRPQQTKEVPVEFLETTRPDKKDKVLVIGGVHSGETGMMMAIDNQDGIVKMDINFDIKIFSMKDLAKFIGGV